MLRKLVFPLIIALTLIVSACTPATSVPTAIPATITLTDGLGRSVTLAGPAQKVVSLAPSTTEILYAIGAGAQVVGRDKNSDYPEDAKKVAEISGEGYGKVNAEAVLALGPDLVLAADITPQEQIKSLEDLGLTVFALPNPTELDGMYDNLRTVATLTGHTDETETLITSLKARVKAVEDKLAPISSRPLVFYEIDGTDPKAPWTAGPGSFIETMIEMAGGSNVGSGLKDQWAQISLEELVKQDPAIIVLGDTVFGGNTPELVKQRAGWDGLTAVKNDKIFPFDDNLMSRPGPRLVDGLEALAKLLHPGVFE